MDIRDLPSRIMVGMLAEDTFVGVLCRAGADPERSKILDCAPYHVDSLIRNFNGQPLPQPVEVQATIGFDDPPKMRNFLEAPPFSDDPRRIYLETWSKSIMPIAARMIAALLARWQTQPPVQKPVPLFLRVGPMGDWLADLLPLRIARLTRLLQLHHPMRRTGTIVEVRNGSVFVQDAEGNIVEIPIRLTQKRARAVLRWAEQNGCLPKDREISFLPGGKDASGTRVFLGKLVNDEAGAELIRRRVLDMATPDDARTAREQERRRVVSERIYRRVAELERVRDEEERQLLVTERVPAAERSIAETRALLEMMSPREAFTQASCLHEEEDGLSRLQRRLEILNIKLALPPEPIG